MGRKAKRTNTIYFGPNDPFVFAELPEGYFYKNRFHTEAKCFAALLEDNEVEIHRFPNGTWEYQDLLYSSLRELYEWNEDEIDMPFNEFALCYKTLGVTHKRGVCTLYTYDKDDYKRLFDYKSEVLLEIRNETNLIESIEDREERYLEDVTKEECIAYFKKPIKERIRILEELK